MKRYCAFCICQEDLSSDSSFSDFDSYSGLGDFIADDDSDSD